LRGTRVGSKVSTVMSEVVMNVQESQAIDNVGVCVADLARAVAFYELLGFEKAFEICVLTRQALGVIFGRPR